jgi:hypothetical protein
VQVRCEARKDRFPQDSVPATRHDNKRGARNEFGQDSRILWWDQFVEVAGQHQSGTFDLGKTVRAVEFGERLELQVRGMQRRR